MSSAPPAAALLKRLALAGGWAASPALFEGLPWAPAILEDHLADLVTQGRALYNARSREYRLAGEPAQRRALLEVLRDPACDRFTKLVQGTSASRLGIAQRVGDQVVMVEIEIPRPADAAAALAQDLAIAQLVAQGAAA